MSKKILSIVLALVLVLFAAVAFADSFEGIGEGFKPLQVKVDVADGKSTRTAHRNIASAKDEGIAITPNFLTCAVIQLGDQRFQKCTVPLFAISAERAVGEIDLFFVFLQELFDGRVILVSRIGRSWEKLCHGRLDTAVCKIDLYLCVRDAAVITAVL